MSEFTLYRLFDHEGQVLYVGASRKVKARISSHRAKPWGPEIDATRTELTPYATEVELRRAERKAMAEQPGRHNLAGPAHHMPYLARQGVPLRDGTDRETQARILDTAAGLHGMSAKEWTKTHGKSYYKALDMIADHLDAHPEDAGRLDADGFMPAAEERDLASDRMAELLRRYGAFDSMDVQGTVHGLARHFTLPQITAAWLEMLAHERDLAVRDATRSA